MAIIYNAILASGVPRSVVGETQPSTDRYSAVLSRLHVHRSAYTICACICAQWAFEECNRCEAPRARFMCQRMYICSCRMEPCMVGQMNDFLHMIVDVFEGLFPYRTCIYSRGDALVVAPGD